MIHDAKWFFDQNESWEFYKEETRKKNLNKYLSKFTSFIPLPQQLFADLHYAPQNIPFIEKMRINDANDRKETLTQDNYKTNIRVDVPSKHSNKTKRNNFFGYENEINFKMTSRWKHEKKLPSSFWLFFRSWKKSFNSQCAKKQIPNPSMKTLLVQSFSIFYWRKKIPDSLQTTIELDDD